MAQSPNYGFPEPDNTGLVKNGAQDMRALGDAIDAFLNRPLARNVCYNSNFDIWQRGTSFTSTGYWADRWYGIIGGTITASRESTIKPNDAMYSMKILTGASSSFANLNQAFEDADVESMLGKTIVATIYVRSIAGFSGTTILDVETNTTANTMTGGTWTTAATANITPSTSAFNRITVTYTVPAATKGLRIVARFGSAQASGTGVYWSQAQVEVGNQASPFTRAGDNIQAELAMCQRYYQIIGNTVLNENISTGQCVSTTAGYSVVPLKVTMRTAPSVSFGSQTTFYMTTSTYSLLSTTQMIANVLGANTLQIYSTVASGLIPGNAYLLLNNSLTTGTILVSAEL